MEAFMNNFLILKFVWWSKRFLTNMQKPKQNKAIGKGETLFHSAADRLCLFQCMCSISLINFLVWINTASHLLISSIIIDHSDQPKSSISSTVDIWQECLSGNSTKCFFSGNWQKSANIIFQKHLNKKKFKHFNALHYFAFYCIKTYAVFLTLITGNLLNISPTKTSVFTALKAFLPCERTSWLLETLYSRQNYRQCLEGLEVLHTHMNFTS